MSAKRRVLQVGSPALSCLGLTWPRWSRYAFGTSASVSCGQSILLRPDAISSLPNRKRLRGLPSALICGIFRTVDALNNLVC